MPRPWKRKAVLKNNQIQTYKQLVEFGNSHALVIPKQWVRHFAMKDEEGKYWVKIKYDGTNKIIVGGDND